MPRQVPNEKKEEAAKFKSSETCPAAPKGCSEGFNQEQLYGAESFTS
jgi:hypothetical protein